MRLRAGLSQRELARLIGIAQPNISAYESGRLAPSQPTLAKIEEATKVRPSALLVQARDQILDAARRHHATDVRVFGSIGAGTDTVGSDLDLLVHFDDEASLYDQIGLAEELESILLIDVDVISDGASGVDRIPNVVSL